MRYDNNSELVGDVFAAQCRMARAALNWSREDLADASGLSVALVKRYEGAGPWTVGATAALRSAFEAERIRFTINGEGYSVTRLK